MQIDGLLHTNLSQVDNAEKRLETELSDDFFEGLEQDEIIGGAVRVSILADRSAGGVYRIQIKAVGKVTVACDRCLDALVLDVDASDTIELKDGTPGDGDSVDVKYLERGQRDYDVAWDIYEIIETSLPLQRVHPDGSCNQEMVAHLYRA